MFNRFVKELASLYLHISCITEDRIEFEAWRAWARKGPENWIAARPPADDAVAGIIHVDTEFTGNNWTTRLAQAKSPLLKMETKRYLDDWTKPTTFALTCDSSFIWNRNESQHAAVEFTDSWNSRNVKAQHGGPEFS